MSCLRDSIRQIDPSFQELIEAIENASSLTLLVLSAWHLARMLAIKLVVEVLTERAQRPTQWPNCPKCGKRLHSKGFIPRQITSVIGTIRWKRRVGRCPKGCTIGQIAPLDNALGLIPHQRTSIELQRLGCLLAVFVPFETVSVILNCLISVQVSSTAVWHWVQKAGQKAMDCLNRQLAELAAGQLPQMESLDEAISVLPLLIGAEVLWFSFDLKVEKVARCGRK